MQLRELNNLLHETFFPNGWVNLLLLNILEHKKTKNNEKIKIMTRGTFFELLFLTFIICLAKKQVLSKQNCEFKITQTIKYSSFSTSIKGQISKFIKIYLCIIFVVQEVNLKILVKLIATNMYQDQIPFMQ